MTVTVLYITQWDINMIWLLISCIMLMLDRNKSVVPGADVFYVNYMNIY